MSKNFKALPENLPIPEDDGAADHLIGILLPSIPLSSTAGAQVDLSGRLGWTVVYAYPRTGRPDEPVFYEGWESIPGARGCTPQSCSFRDHYNEINELGAEVFGLSTQSTEFQLEAAERLQLPFSVLSDENLDLTKKLKLPTFSVNDLQLLKRLTLMIRNGRVEHVFYPVFPPDTHAEDVIAWLRNQPR